MEMKRYIFFFILMLIIIGVDCTTPVGYIYNATYISNDTKTIITYENTCTECICNGLFSNVSPSYVALNCYQNNKTCELFTNYSTTFLSSSMIKINLNSIFIFLQRSSQGNTTTTVTYPLIGVTVAGYGNGTAGNALNALRCPWGLTIDVNDTLYVAEWCNYRMMKIKPGSLNGTIFAGTGVSGTTNNQLYRPTEIAVDSDGNVYVNDDFAYRVMLWRRNASSGIRVVGTGIAGSSSNTIGESIGLAIDARGNVYVSDKTNHRVMKWAPNVTEGTIVAGTGAAGDTSEQLNNPYGLYLDEINSDLYIADWANHRIQKYRLGNSNGGTTVAGGNGQGSGSHQLNEPYSVCVSKITGDIYIADKANHRIQRWSPGATSGVTIAGITGVNGSDAILLYAPSNVILSQNETYLYVADRFNNRVQRFELT